MSAPLCCRPPLQLWTVTRLSLRPPASDLCLQAHVSWPHAAGRDIIYMGCRPGPLCLLQLPGPPESWALYTAGDRPITRPGGRNGTFVMVVISLLCSQVELRWNSTGSHCVPIFRTLKEICWVLKGWNEARRASADLALWGNTQWKHNGNNLVLHFPFVFSWTLVSVAHLRQSLFNRTVLSHSSLLFLSSLFFFFFLLASFWERPKGWWDDSRDFARVWETLRVYYPHSSKCQVCK